MNHNFKDITEKLGKPLWYDQLGYPRYCKFHPKEMSNIYACIGVLLEIGCQACGEKFLVSCDWDEMNIYSGFKERMIKAGAKGSFKIKEWILPLFKSFNKDELTGIVHWGDPPAHNCVGDTMNCNDLRIKEFWLRLDFNWKRHKEFEIELENEEEKD